MLGRTRGEESDADSQRGLHVISASKISPGNIFPVEISLGLLPLRSAMCSRAWVASHARVCSQIKANEKGDALVITCDDGSQLEVLELQPVGKKVRNADSLLLSHSPQFFHSLKSLSSDRGGRGHLFCL